MTFADVLSSAGAIFIDPALLGAMLAGLVMGMVFGAVPGLSGKMGLLLLLPLLFGMDAEVGIVLLLSMHAVIHTGGSIPSILVGVPGGAAEAATVIDGFAMAKQGRAAEALGASMAASAIGGALGAVSYFLLLPVFGAVGHIFRAPEILVLAFIGMCAVATLSRGSMAKGFVMAALGLLAGSVGLDVVTATPRYTFGLLELWDGLDLLILVTGLFAVPELLDLARKKSLLPDGAEAAARCTYRAMFRGMAEAGRHGWLTLRTTAIGIVIGIIPGLGAEVASWLGYSHAIQSARDKSRFGQGAVEGVIAPETANNSKEGGALLPTVVFGIPGSSAMALLIAGLAILGVQAGPNLVASQPGVVILMGWTILWSNLAAVAAFLLVLPAVGKMVYLRVDVLAPVVLTIAVVGTLVDQTGWPPLAVLFGVSLLGCYFVRADWPRAPFLLAFIMGRMAETNLVKTTAIYGWDALARWPTLALLALLVYLLVRGVRIHRGEIMRSLAASDVVVVLILVVAFIAAGAVAATFPFEARLLPLAACLFGLLALATLLFGHLRSRASTAAEPPLLPWRLLAEFAIFLALLPMIGAALAGAAYAGLHGSLQLRHRWWQAACLAAGTGAAIWLLFGHWLRLPVLPPAL